VLFLSAAKRNIPDRFFNNRLKKPELGRARYKKVMESPGRMGGMEYVFKFG